MRTIILSCLAIVLAACGQASTPPSVDDTASLPEWRVALTDQPVVVRPYSPPAGLAPLEGGTVSDGSNGSGVVTTPAAHGAWAAMLTTGPDGDVRGTALRIRARVDRGALIFASTYAGADPSAVSASETVQAGEETVVYLPLDKTGNPALIVANGAHGEASSGSVLEIELIEPPPAT